MLNNFSNDEIKIAVVGLGYVGLPLAVLFSKKYPVIGFDLNKYRIEQYKKGIDITGELEENALSNSNILFTNSPKELKNANFIIISVPTPINENKLPSLINIRSATKIVANNLRKESIIVFESTVYPGATEEICIPSIEKISGYTCGNEFSVGYSPERISIGEKDKTVANISKIVSGFDEKTLKIISKIYDSVINEHIYEAPSIKVAEAAKVTENIQRDVNIALMNELSIIFDNIGINTMDVIDAAGSKWNFVKYSPGLVGGHCISVDPYYLIYKSRKLDFTPRLIQTSRSVNEDMVDYVTDKILTTLTENDVKIEEANILVLGTTFKENCNDIRNSKILDIDEKLNDKGITTVLYDPYADSLEFHRTYGKHLTEDYSGEYDAIILSVAHDKFKELSYERIWELSRKKPIVFDLKSVLKELSEENIVYWSL